MTAGSRPVWALIGLLAVAVAVAGCGFEPGFDQTRYRCGAYGACPSGFSCLRGFCEASARDDVDASVSPSVVPPDEAMADAALADAGPVATADAGTTDAAVGGAPDAGAVPTFEDRFDDGVLTGWSAWTHTGCTAAEASGFIELTYSGSGDAYCGVDSERGFDLRGASVSVEVAQAPLVANFDTYIILFSGQQQLVMVRNADSLTMQLKKNGAVTSSRTIASDLTSQRFWRIREAAGTVSWDTSPDRVTWTRKHSTATTIDISALVVELAAGHYAPGPGAPVLIHFDRLIVL